MQVHTNVCTCEHVHTHAYTQCVKAQKQNLLSFYQMQHKGKTVNNEQVLLFIPASIPIKYEVKAQENRLHV